MQENEEKENEHKILVHRRKKPLTVAALAAMIFFDVAGSPGGSEPAMVAAGPFYTLLGFMIMPFIWSIPEALVTAELATMFPEDGGFVAWVSAAFGEFWGFIEFVLHWTSEVINNAVFPVMIADYVTTLVPALGEPVYRVPLMALSIFFLVYLNWRGLELVGLVSVILIVISLFPFGVMVLMGLPSLDLSKCLERRPIEDVDWGLLLNTLFWNLNYFDSPSTLAAEVENPNETFPKALRLSLVIIVGMYLLAFIVGIGVTPAGEEWTDDYFSRVGELVGGSWLKSWIVGAISVSSIGMFEAHLSSNAYLILGMTKRGMLPAVLAQKSRYGTPKYAILLSCSALFFSFFLSFEELIEILNIMYIWAVALEFLAFVSLRINRPDANRPYKLALGTTGSILMLIPSFIFIFAALIFSSLKSHLACFGCVLIGGVGVFVLRYLRKHRIVRFFPTTPWDQPLPEEITVQSTIDLELLYKSSPS